MEAKSQLEVTLSIVSHGQCGLVACLLEDFAAGIDVPVEIILTINIPEDESPVSGLCNRLNVRVIRNNIGKGFGANHNAAFEIANGRYFAVVNPDIRLRGFRLQPVLTALDQPGVGACGPKVLSPRGKVEDSARRFPSLWGLFKRRVLGARKSEYIETNSPYQVDWLAGMFVVFRREAFANVGGFDETFFMYMEDADICCRLRYSGWSVLLVPNVSVVHDARRASSKSIRHFFWHASSAFRYFVKHGLSGTRKL